MALTFDLSQAKLFAFEVNQISDANDASVAITWRIPVPGGYELFRAEEIPVEDLVGFNLAAVDVYGLLYDNATSAGHTVTDTTDLRELGP